MKDKVRSEKVKAGLKASFPYGRLASDNPNWKGGRRLGGNGYVEIYKPGHYASKRNYVFEHRLVMSEFLKRPLRSDEHVHHINNDKLDNRIENLELMTRAEHARMHMTTLRRVTELEEEVERLKKRLQQV